MNIIELAKEAGFEVDEGLFPFEAAEDKFIGTERVLESFAALVRAEVEAEWVETNKALAKEIIEREWVDLTDDEIGAVMDFGYATDAELENARAVITAFKEKNK